MIFLILCVEFLEKGIPIIQNELMENERIVFRLPEKLTKGYIVPELINKYGRPFDKEEITIFLHDEDNIPKIPGSLGAKVLSLKSGEHDLDIKEELERCYIELIIFKNTLPLIKELQELSIKSIDKTDIEFHKEVERKKLEGKMRLKMKRNEELNRIRLESEKKGGR